jgi:hypothetical protein
LDPWRNTGTSRESKIAGKERQCGSSGIIPPAPPPLLREHGVELNFLFPATTVRANPFLWNFPLEIFLRTQRPDDVSVSKGMDSYEFPVFHLGSKGGPKLYRVPRSKLCLGIGSARLTCSIMRPCSSSICQRYWFLPAPFRVVFSWTQHAFSAKKLKKVG